MPSSRVLLIGPSPSRVPPSQALEMLRLAELPKLTKCVLTDSKIEPQSVAKTFNIEAGYAADAAQQATFANWSGLQPKPTEQLLDGQEIFAVRTVVERDGPFGYVILQRQAADLTQLWPKLEQEIGDSLYLDLGDGNFVLNLRATGGLTLLDDLWELYRTGAVYGLVSYSFGLALDVAVQASRCSATVEA
ncbi:hypothetical protein G7077_03230 [Sphingomonas piscis]|uniref:Uncharacterized protein n=1 Tax=Sphingomonas piscis TaxID=2714943 RepID=A0A6G7YMV3_9SPHN|nr:hypothetical protein [Sphingomonas piscis]QIK78070.1 hypothetical protein G7077_03230 [Sphingomonas piscis]